MDQAQYDLLWELLECPECTGGREEVTFCGGLFFDDGACDEDGEADYTSEDCQTCSGNGIRPDIVAYHWRTLEDLIAEADQITVLPFRGGKHYLESAEIMVGALFVWLASGAEQSEAA